MRRPHATDFCIPRGRTSTNVSTSAGSHHPAFASPRMIWSAASTANALRYGRSVVSASNTSTTLTMRASSGMASPASPSG